MMRVSKVLGFVVAGLAGFVALSTTSESRAGGDADLVSYTCDGGDLKAHGKDGWHPNPDAPWKWDHGKKVKIDKEGNLAHFQGDSCAGTLKAFICNKDSCKGPVAIAITSKK